MLLALLLLAGGAIAQTGSNPVSNALDNATATFPRCNRVKRCKFPGALSTDCRRW